MKQGYEDIIELPHHRSSRHAPLPMESRAAQFLPFAALTGYEDAISETERQTEHFQELDDGIKAVLDAKLQMLEERKMEKPLVVIRYFVPDERKAGGSYQVVSGRYQRTDRWKKQVLLEEGEGILLERIVDICSEIFEREGMY